MKHVLESIYFCKSQSWDSTLCGWPHDMSIYPDFSHGGIAAGAEDVHPNKTSGIVNDTLILPNMDIDHCCQWSTSLHVGPKTLHWVLHSDQSREWVIRMQNNGAAAGHHWHNRSMHSARRQFGLAIIKVQCPVHNSGMKTVLFVHDRCLSSNGSLSVYVSLYVKNKTFILQHSNHISTIYYSWWFVSPC